MSSKLGAPAMVEMGRLFREGTLSGLSDRDLRARLARRGDRDALEALVSRHGPMVLSACRRMLSDPHDVDDAFQATFLILASRAGTLRDADRLGPWLHSVAVRVAGRARADATRRRGRQTPLVVEPAAATDSSSAPELRSVLDEEVGRLPEKYRAPVILCYFESKTHDEAALDLGWPVGTVRSRLAGARDRLRTRLVRRGLAPESALLIGVDLSRTIPPSLLAATVAAPTAEVTGRALASASILAQGVISTMTWHGTRWIAPALVASTLAAGAVVIGQQPGPGPGQEPAAGGVRADAAPPPTPVTGLIPSNGPGVAARRPTTPGDDPRPDEPRPYSVRVLEARILNAKRLQDKRRELHKTGAISDLVWFETQATFEELCAQVESWSQYHRDEVERLQASLGYREAGVRVAEARGKRARAALDRSAALQKRGPNYVSETEVRAQQADVDLADAECDQRKAELLEVEILIRQAKRKADQYRNLERFSTEPAPAPRS